MHWPREHVTSGELSMYICVLLAVQDRSESTSRLHAAVENGNCRVAVSSIVDGANFNALSSTRTSLLHLACACRRLAIVNAMLQFGVIVNVADNTGRTPLHAACSVFYTHQDSPSLVTALIRHGADVNAVDRSGRTPLMFAVLCGLWETVDAIRQACGTVQYDLRCMDGRTALDWAVRQRKLRIAHILRYGVIDVRA